MRRCTSRWTTAIAAAALLGVPAVGLAQTTPQTPSTQTQTATASQQSQSATSPADHVRAAREALDKIPQSSIPAADRAKFAQLKTHLSRLNRDVSNTSASAAKSATAKWDTEVAAIDKILTGLIGPETGAAAGESAEMSGTAGATGTSGRNTKALDETARTQLQEVRRHITELAASMGGANAPADSASNAAAASSSAASPDAMGTPASSSSSTASSATEPTSAAQPSSTGSMTGQESATPATPQSTPSSTEPSSTEQNPQAQPPAMTGQQQTPGAAQVDTAAAKQALSDARDSLAQLASLPQAAQLQGETRTQVSQLISNFNELITTQTNWRDSYAKVETSLNALLGPDASNPSAATSSSTMTGTAGTSGTGATSATGTSGTEPSTPATATEPNAAANAAGSQLDPAIRAKLVEFRTHLDEFAKAAGGAEPGNAAMASSASQTPAATAGAPAQSAVPPTASTTSSTNPANPSNPQSPAMTGTPESSANPSYPSEAATAGAVGTSGAASATPSATDAQADAAHAQAGKELDAIQAILSQAKNGKLDKTQVDQLKAHVDQLRQLIGQSK